MEARHPSQTGIFIDQQEFRVSSNWITRAFCARVHLCAFFRNAVNRRQSRGITGNYWLLLWWTDLAGRSNPRLFFILVRVCACMPLRRSNVHTFYSAWIVLLTCYANISFDSRRFHLKSPVDFLSICLAQEQFDPSAGFVALLPKLTQSDSRRGRWQSLLVWLTRL